MWGGEHISLHVAERGARVEFDCAHATIARSIVRDRRGRFSVAGIYVEEHGGPVRESESADGYAVRFDGRVEGQTMKLNVTRTSDKEIIGTFTLVYKREPFLVKCR
jgi:diaminopimelate epimerase